MVWVFSWIVYCDLNTLADGVPYLVDTLSNISFYFYFMRTLLCRCLYYYVDVIDIVRVLIYTYGVLCQAFFMPLVPPYHEKFGHVTDDTNSNGTSLILDVYIVVKLIYVTFQSYYQTNS